MPIDIVPVRKEAVEGDPRKKQGSMRLVQIDMRRAEPVEGDQTDGGAGESLGPEVLVIGARSGGLVGLVVLDRDLVGLLVGHGIFQAHPAGKPRPAVPRQCFQTHVDVSKPLASRYSRNCHQVPSIIGIPFPTTHQDVLVVHCVRLDVRDENQCDNGRCDRESRAQPERSLNVNTVAASQRPAPPTVLYLYESSGPKLAWIWGKVYVPMKAPTAI